MNYGDLGKENGKRLYERIRNLPFDPIVCCDVGVRAGVSSSLMLEATLGRKKSTVIGIEASKIPAALKANPRYRAIDETDSVTALAKLEGPVHCAFVDTLHIAEQVMCETFYLWKLIPVGGFIAYHDTCWPEWKDRDFYCGRFWDSPEVGIERMFPSPHGRVQIETFPDSWGCTFVAKLDECDLAGDMQAAFAARDELLGILPESVKRTSGRP